MGILGFGVGLISKGDIFLDLFDFLKLSSCLWGLGLGVGVGGWVPLHVLNFDTVLFTFYVLLLEVPRGLVGIVGELGPVAGLGFYHLGRSVEGIRHSVSVLGLAFQNFVNVKDSFWLKCNR